MCEVPLYRTVDYGPLTRIHPDRTQLTIGRDAPATLVLRAREKGSGLRGFLNRKPRTPNPGPEAGFGEDFTSIG
jgi:hypothetical protein